jgi:hypothetical protein
LNVFKPLLPFFLILFCSGLLTSQCQPNTFLPAAGNWSVAANWSCGWIPKNDDNVLIPASKVCTVDMVTSVLDNVRIWLYGTLYFQCGAKIRLACNSSLVIFSGGTMLGACNGSKLEYCGSFVWDGNDGPVTGPASYPNSALPIQLLYFQGYYDSSGFSVLQWKTATEKDNDHFLIEKSTDGVNFENFGIVDGAGTTIYAQQYELKDESPFVPVTYYRLNSVEYNGTTERGPIIAVSTGEPKGKFRIMPSPLVLNGTGFLEIPEFITDESVRLVFYDINGGKVMETSLSVPFSGSRVVNLPSLAGLSRGMYNAVLMYGRGSQSAKVLIQ